MGMVGWIEVAVVEAEVADCFTGGAALGSGEGF